MSVWSEPFPCPIAPKSGPMRRMETLSQMNKALTKDLPFKQLCQPRWQQAARLVVHAAATGMGEDIHSACEAVVEALDNEGWMTAERARPRLGAEISRELSRILIAAE